MCFCTCVISIYQAQCLLSLCFTFCSLVIGSLSSLKTVKTFLAYWMLQLGLPVNKMYSCDDGAIYSTVFNPI